MSKKLYQEKIVELLDGELPKEEASDLYSQISSDQSLQKEMQDHIKLKNMIKVGLNTPPDILKSNIYKSTGLVSTNYYRYLLVIPILLAFGLGYYISNDDINYRNEVAIIESLNLKTLNKDLVVAEKNNIEISSKIPVSTSVGIKKSKQTKSSKNAIPIKSLNDKNDYKPTENGNTNLSNNLAINNTMVVDDSPLQYLNKVNQNEYPLDNVQLQNLRFDNSVFNTNDAKNITLELKGLNLNNFHQSDVENFNTGINNFSVAAYYSVNSNFKIGAEFGQENFIQKYHFNDGEFTTNYEQNYTSNYLGVSAKFADEFLKELPNLNFYSRLFLGSMMTGPIGRLEAGLSYQIANRYSLFIGYDLAHTTYFFKGNDFHSTKSGMVYGVTFKL
ncbi:hypothetical protein OAQ99_07350 [Candidatus Kapabacteria bacterium]|nr:hypothetical protein [Candidatus Kapabacteria bacterium]